MQNLAITKNSHRRWFATTAAAAAMLVSTHSSCIAQPGEPEPKPPRRLALVIGNRTYANIAPLPSVDVDVARMSSNLRDLGFDVTPYDSVPSEDYLENTILPTFKAKLKKGDLVVFYFSGHGFTYGASSYLAPANLPAKISRDDITDYALPVESVEDYFEDSEPGVLLIIVDACRSIASFIVDDGSATTTATDSQHPPSAPLPAPAVRPGGQLPAGTIGKGFSEGVPPNGYTVETLIAYASKAGYEAIARSDPGKPSLFTGDLIAYIAREDVEFKQMYGLVSSDVDFDSGKKQRAGLAVWTATSLFMKQSPAITSQERTAWLAALNTQDARSISRFLQTHAVSPYAQQARAWLKDNSKEQRSPSLLSPQLVDNAWTNSSKTLSAQLEDIGFPSHAAAVPPAQFAPPVVASAGSDRSERIRSAFDGLVAAGSLVTMHPLKGFASPDIKGSPVTTLAAGTVVKVTADSQRKSIDGKSWIEGKVGGAGTSIFLPVQLATAPKTVDLGKDLRELVAPPQTSGLVDLVQEKSIVDSVAELKAQGRTIRWVSLASGHTDDKIEHILRAGRLVHAAYVLRNAGIPSDHITSVDDASDLQDSGVRVRFYGE